MSWIYRSYGVRSDFVAGDLSNLSNIESLWSDVLKLYADGIDILINNAGENFFVLMSND